MSDEMGLYVKLEADAGEFSAVMSTSARALANLKVETEKLKQGEKEIRAAIESTTKSYENQGNRIKELKKELREKQTALDKAKKSYGENSTQVKNLQQAISDLNQAIKANTKNYSDNEKQIERLNNDLVDNLKGQIDIKNEVKQVNSVIAKQTQEYQKNAKEAENTTSATGKLRDGFNTLRAIALGQNTYNPCSFNRTIRKNYKNNLNQLIPGDELLKMACDKVSKIQSEISGRIVYLECEDKVALIEFYTKNPFLLWR